MSNRTAKLMALCALGIFPHLLPAREKSSHFVVTNRFDDYWHAQSASGQVKIALREIRVEVTGPYGKAVSERILILFEPKSGTFSWSVFDEDSLASNTSRQTRALENERTVYLKDKSLVTFMGGISPSLYVRDIRGRAMNMREAEADALAGAAALHKPPSREDEMQLWRTVQLLSLGRDFVSPPMSAQVGLTPKVMGVQWDGQHWEVTLQGQWTEAITLDSSYSVVAMRKVK